MSQSRPSVPDLATLPTLGHVLVEQGVLTQEQLRQALDIQARGGKRLLLGEVLLSQGIVDKTVLLRAVANSRGVDFIEEPASVFEEGSMALVPELLRREHRVCPLYLSGNELVVATADPQNYFVQELISRETGFKVRFVASPDEKIDALLVDPIRAASQVSKKAEEIVANLMEESGGGELSLQEHQAEEMIGFDAADDVGPVVKLVNFIICSAVQEGASDIHIEPDDGKLRVRFRIDGVLFPKMTPPYRMHAALSSRIKIMGHMDISERRVPQDGEISVKVNGKPIDLRVSSLPGKHGEKIVMRVIDVSTSKLGLEKLGFRPKMLATFQEVINQPYGIVLVTGPTGSGKSTTLYSVLGTFDTVGTNVSTVEDPVEANLEGVHQSQINPKAGFTFAGALRALLRQDPDIIMVGEIRDGETGQIAVQAALTGHLVLSTLHTNDAPSAITRLQNLGVEPFLVAASLKGVLAQRLVRRICKDCKEEFVPDAAQISSMAEYGDQCTKLWRGKGCPKCHDGGLSGRVGLYELMVPDDALVDAICADSEPAVIREVLKKNGYLTLWDDGINKVLEGHTTLEEVYGSCRR
ncbi:MAG: Flp pilus assembly complex ATPase component TadA [Phycisphaerae bacterium]|nr:Flp pilus assembly complex ATPase component TadA [Phycisphaerae bacterium]